MQSASHQASPVGRWLWLPGLLLIVLGAVGLYFRYKAYIAVAPSQISAALLCKIYPPAPVQSESGNSSKANQAAPAEPTSLTGATLKLSGAPKASIDETVVLSLCVQPAPGLPEQRQQALKGHLLVQLSAVGLQVEPHEKISPVASSPECLGTAEWTMRANAPGRYAAVLVPESTDDQPNHPVASPPKPRCDFDLEHPARFDIQFQDAWTSVVQKAWSPISALLGIVLVITQIMLNLKQRSKTPAA